MNKIFLYDGTFSSLMALIYYLIVFKHTPFGIKDEKKYINNLLDNPIYLNLEKKEEKYKTITNYLSKNIINTAYYIYLSDDENKELIIYYFIKNSLKFKNEIFFQRNLNCVNKALNLRNYVLGEAHKMKGFLRFKETKNNFLYAEMSPTNNIIEIIASHFQKRLKNNCWIIKDVKRNLLAIYDLKKISYYDEKDIIKLNLENNNDEDLVEILWKKYFKTIGIKERKNEKVQMNFMPKKYWNYMLEMEDNK